MNIQENATNLTVKLKNVQNIITYSYFQVGGYIEGENGTQIDIDFVTIRYNKGAVLIDMVFQTTINPINVFLTVIGFYSSSETGEEIDSFLIVELESAYVPFSTSLDSIILMSTLTNPDLSSFNKTYRVLYNNQGKYEDFFQMEVMITTEFSLMALNYRQRVIQQLMNELDHFKVIVLSPLIPSDVLQTFVRDNYSRMPRYAGRVFDLSIKQLASSSKVETFLRDDHYSKYPALLERPNLLTSIANEIDELRYRLGFDHNMGYYLKYNTTGDNDAFSLTEHILKVIPSSADMILRRSSDFFRFFGQGQGPTVFAMHNFLNDLAVISDIAYASGMARYYSIPRTLASYGMYKAIQYATDPATSRLQNYFMDGVSSTAVATSDYFLNRYRTLNEIVKQIGGQFLFKPVQLGVSAATMYGAAKAMNYLSRSQLGGGGLGRMVLGQVLGNEAFRYVPQVIDEIVGAPANAEILEGIDNMALVSRGSLWDLNSRQNGFYFPGYEAFLDIKNLYEQMKENPSRANNRLLLQSIRTAPEAVYKFINQLSSASKVNIQPFIDTDSVFKQIEIPLESINKLIDQLSVLNNDQQLVAVASQIEEIVPDFERVYTFMRQYLYNQRQREIAAGQEQFNLRNSVQLEYPQNEFFPIEGAIPPNIPLSNELLKSFYSTLVGAATVYAGNQLWLKYMSGEQKSEGQRIRKRDEKSQRKQQANETIQLIRQNQTTQPVYNSSSLNNSVNTTTISQQGKRNWNVNDVLLGLGLMTAAGGTAYGVSQLLNRPKRNVTVTQNEVPIPDNVPMLGDVINPQQVEQIIRASDMLDPVLNTMIMSESRRRRRLNIKLDRYNSILRRILDEDEQDPWVQRKRNMRSYMNSVDYISKRKRY